MDRIKRLTIWIVLLTLIAACDSFQDDVAPKGEEEFELQTGVSALPNTTLFIDLKKNIRSSEPIKFQINTPPTRGQASISDQALLRYIPHNDFMTGQDFLSLNLVNGVGAIVDTDTIIISMASDTTELPCFNGALSDYYEVDQGRSIVLFPLQNDGYCAQLTSGAILNIIDEPENGDVKQLDLFQYQYTPAPDFVGTDSFMYELTLVDQNDNEYYSLAQVIVEVFERQNPCDSALFPFSYEISDGGQSEYYYIEAYRPDPFCGDNFGWRIELLGVASGSAEVEGALIKYYPGQDTIDFINYAVLFDNRQDTLINTITVVYYEGAFVGCTRARDDDFYLYVVQDSIGTSIAPIYWDPIANDDYCEEYQWDLLSNPEIGTMNITEDQLIEYWVDEEFTGTQSTMVPYVLCSQSTCDTARIFITIEK